MATAHAEIKLHGTRLLGPSRLITPPSFLGSAYAIRSFFLLVIVEVEAPSNELVSQSFL